MGTLRPRRLHKPGEQYRICSARWAERDLSIASDQARLTNQPRNESEVTTKVEVPALNPPRRKDPFVVL